VLFPPSNRSTGMFRFVSHRLLYVARGRSPLGLLMWQQLTNHPYEEDSQTLSVFEYLGTRCLQMVRTQDWEVAIRPCRLTACVCVCTCVRVCVMALQGMPEEATEVCMYAVTTSCLGVRSVPGRRWPGSHCVPRFHCASVALLASPGPTLRL